MLTHQQAGVCLNKWQMVASNKFPEAQQLALLNLQRKLTSFTETTWSPLHFNKLTLYVLLSNCPSCDKYTPSLGIIQGLKYDKNFSVSWPWTSLYWTVQDPRAASNSSALSDAKADSTCKHSVSNLRPSYSNTNYLSNLRFYIQWVSVVIKKLVLNNFYSPTFFVFKSLFYKEQQ